MTKHTFKILWCLHREIFFKNVRPFFIIMHEMVKTYRLSFKNMLFDTSDQEFGSRWLLTL